MRGLGAVAVGPTMMQVALFFYEYETKETLQKKFRNRGEEFRSGCDSYCEAWERKNR